jgi:Protein of unknown function (DUF2924)
MNVSIASEVVALRRLSIRELRAKYAEVFGDEARTTNNRVWLVRRIAWRLQAVAEGDLSERARQRAAELANDADIRLSPPRRATSSAAPPQPKSATVPAHAARQRLPRAGTVLTRLYKGETLQVKVLEHGVSFDGAIYTSLSAVAKAITGSHCSGNLFFRLNGQRGGQ